MAGGKKPAKPLKISEASMMRSRERRVAQQVNPFEIPANLHPPAATPKGLKLAQDSVINTSAAWASGAYGYAVEEGMTFLGYPELSIMATRPEYRRITEVMARQMTRKWIKLQAKGDEDKSDKIDQLNEALERIGAKAAFCQAAEHDGFFGRGHIYVDLGTTDDRAELQTPIGDGYDLISRAKIKKGSLRRLQNVEPIWTYPTSYESNNPLKPDWYNPSQWMVMGTQMHVSRLLTFVGREVPDLLKPTYSFGGLSLSQMAKPYVDNWLFTRQNVADIINAFSVFVLETNLLDQLNGNAEDLFKRAEFFNNVRDNRGLMMTDKNLEGFKNVAAPLGTLDALQAQTQEHMAAVSGIPILFLLGIQPAGLNASSEGEIRSFYDWVHSCQETAFRNNLKRLLGIVQLSEFGEVDPDIGFEFEPLWAMDEKAIAEVQKIKAETGAIHIEMGTIDRAEERTRLASDPDSDYQGLEPDDLPDVPDPTQALKMPGETPESVTAPAQAGKNEPPPNKGEEANEQREEERDAA